MMAPREVEKSSFAARISALLSVAGIALVLLPVFLADTPWPTAARDFLEEWGNRDTGAINLVSSIYLGYRVFDTLGETIVLLVAVMGTLGILSRVESLVSRQKEMEGSAAGKTGEDGFSLTREKRHSHALRTDLLEAVTSKIGPLILLFGCYVMLYGHASPGGGFQGGVIVASGIVFLALGNPQSTGSVLTNPSVLSTLETLAFLLLLILSGSALLAGQGFFGNPMAETGEPVAFIVVMNAVIGLKVGASLGFMCITMMGGGHR